MIGKAERIGQLLELRSLARWLLRRLFPLLS